MFEYPFLYIISKEKRRLSIRTRLRFLLSQRMYTVMIPQDITRCPAVFLFNISTPFGSGLLASHHDRITFFHVIALQIAVCLYR